MSTLSVDSCFRVLVGLPARLWWGFVERQINGPMAIGPLIYSLVVL